MKWIYAMTSVRHRRTNAAWIFLTHRLPNNDDIDVKNGTRQPQAGESREKGRLKLGEWVLNCR